MSAKPTIKRAPEMWEPLTTAGMPRKTPSPTITEPKTAREKFFHRDLSWLHFNDRVLSEGADETVPPLERLRFAGIVSSNLDEFFMVRVADIIKKVRRRGVGRFSTKLTAPRVLTQIRDHVLNQKARQAAVLENLLNDLVKKGLILYTEFSETDLDREIRRRLPPIEVMVRALSDPLPSIQSEHIYIFVRFPEEYAVMRLVKREDRLLPLSSTSNSQRYALLERWLAARAAQFFPGREIIEAFPFKIIRDADLRYHPDDEETLEEQIIEALKKRSRAHIVRLEVDAPSYSEGAFFIATALGLGPGSLYRFALPLDLRGLATLYNVTKFRNLHYPPVHPRVPPLLKKRRDLFAAIKKRDVLLHHPYDSFDVIVRYLKQAARDPAVTHIAHTLYRTSQQSPIMEALKTAARRGKHVTAYVEIKARFDELNNLHWAKELRKAGVKVVRPMGGFKVHCKITQITRVEKGAAHSYLHLGTGNYHPATARQYTDLGLLTADMQLGREVTAFLRALNRRSSVTGLSEIMVAPGHLHKRFEHLIREETEIQKKGGRGHIIAKMNALVDRQICRALYDASRAGVKVDLIVRGACCLKPGVKGLSENIRVVSIIDRFLEHSRIYYFRSNGQGKMYLSSADWMPRNFYSRYEIAFPVKDARLKRFLRDVVLATSLADNTKSWLLKPDGTYARNSASPSSKLVRSQFLFEEMARNRYQGTPLEDRSNSSSVHDPFRGTSAGGGRKTAGK